MIPSLEAYLHSLLLRRVLRLRPQVVDLLPLTPQLHILVCDDLHELVDLRGELETHRVQLPQQLHIGTDTRGASCLNRTYDAEASLL